MITIIGHNSNSEKCWLFCCVFCSSTTRNLRVYAESQTENLLYGKPPLKLFNNLSLSYSSCRNNVVFLSQQSWPSEYMCISKVIFFLKKMQIWESQKYPSMLEFCPRIFAICIHARILWEFSPFQNQLRRERRMECPHPMLSVLSVPICFPPWLCVALRRQKKLHLSSAFTHTRPLALSAHTLRNLS